MQTGKILTRALVGIERNFGYGIGYPLYVNRRQFRSIGQFRSKPSQALTDYCGMQTTGGTGPHPEKLVKVC